jgi:DNA-binding transcriptional ArsR family regulator
METGTAVEALSALAQPTRLEVFRLLVQAGPEGLCPGRVSAALGLAPATLSFHLSALRNAGLVSAERRGRERVYRARFDEMHALVDYLTENCCGGESCRTTGADELAGTG